MIKAYNLLGLMQRAGKLITGEDLIIIFVELTFYKLI